MNLDVIVGAIFGGGAATIIATIARIFDSRRKGRIESEDSVITRLEAENRKARSRADEAEMESDDYRKKWIQAEDREARLRRALMAHDLPLPPGMDS